MYFQQGQHENEPFTKPERYAKGTTFKLGTKGVFTNAWARFVQEMFAGEAQESKSRRFGNGFYGGGGGSVLTPDEVKEKLGRYNSMFNDFSQHDSSECINTILKFISEDLYKGERKPYITRTLIEKGKEIEGS